MVIMVIDDSATMRKIVALALQPSNYQVIEAENGQDALAKLSGQKIDIFIVDVNMPVMGGLDFVKQVRGKAEYAKTPVIMLTTESEDKMVTQGKEVGASAWVVKPFKNDEFLALIQKLTA